MAIRTAIVGVGNCAKSLVEGLAFYRNNDDESVGLVRRLIGAYKVGDIEITAAFDIDDRKVGKPLNEALFAQPNCTKPLAPMPPALVSVHRGPSGDSVIPELREYYIHESGLEAVDVGAVLRASQSEIVLNYLPTGSNAVAHLYAEAALNSACSFINCMPAPLGKDTALRDRFARAGLVLLGDDIKSQCGATVLNRMVLSLLRLRGVHLLSSTQVNYGGNADHFNLQFRGQQKEECKEASLLSVIGADDAKPQASMIYREGNFDHKRAVIEIRGEIFGRASVTIDLVLEDEDSPNSGGIVVDAIRATKVLHETGNAHRSAEICAALMKSPPYQLLEEDASQQFDAVIQECLEGKQ